MANEQEARVELTADTRSFVQKLAEAQKKWDSLGRGIAKGGKAFGKETGKSFGAIFGKVGKKGIGLGTAALGIGGVVGVGALVGNEAQKQVRFEEALTRMGIAAGGAIDDLDAFRAKIVDVSNTTGLAREEVLGGASAYLALTGDVGTATSSMELFARIQRATGSSMGDIATSAAALAQNLKIDPSQFERAFSILIAGGKAGSVELRDMAGLMANLAPLAERFAGGSGTKGLANLGAALQLTRQGFGSASEAATGLEALMGAIVQKAGKLEKAGIKVFSKDAKTGRKELRGFQRIVEDIAKSKLGKDPTLLIEALGRKEAEAAFIQLTKVKGAWDQLANSTLNANDVAEDYAEFQQSTAGKLQASWNELQNVIAQTFTPERIALFARALQGVVFLAEKLLQGFEAIGDALRISSEDIAEGQKRVLDAYEGVPDSELEYRAATGDVNAQAALEQRAFRELDRRQSERERLRWEREAEALGAPAMIRGAAYKRRVSDVEVEAAAEEEAMIRKQAHEGRAPGVIGALRAVAHPLLPPAPQRVEVTSRVIVTAGPGIRAEADNDPRQRISP